MVSYEEQRHDTKDEYGTSPELWRPIADVIGGFDVDPASGAEDTPIADVRYTPDEDGLQQEWNGTIWLNPPFSNKEEWYRKALNEVSCGNAELVIALAPGGTSTEWFQRWFSKAEIMCWLEGRNWYNGDDSPSFNSVLGVYGEYPDGLLPVLERKGVITKPIETETQSKIV